jgi:Thioesterase-like superfamily
MSQHNESFFHRDGDQLIPTPSAKGPWQGAGLHGRVIAGLLASEIERERGDPEFMPTRVTVDMYRAPAMAPLSIETRLVRDSKRIRVVDADLISEGRSAGRATIQFLRKGTNPVGSPWHGDTWSVPYGDSLPDDPPRDDTMFGMWEMRWIEGDMKSIGPRKVWMRENRDLIAGEPLTPFARVAVAADYASPLANMVGGPGYTFINSDLTFYLDRLPQGEWIGFESIAHEASEGVAIGHCNLYDEAGRIGWGSACGLVQQVRADVRERAAG